ILEHPEVAARLDAELARVRTPAGDLDLAALASLDYLDAVIKESLRLRPVVPDVVRQVQRPFTLGDYTYPRGVHLTPCIHLAHRPHSLPPVAAGGPQARSARVVPVRGGHPPLHRHGVRAVRDEDRAGRDPRRRAPAAGVAGPGAGRAALGDAGARRRHARDPR